MQSAFHEFDLIQRIRQRAGESSRVPLGIGDDAAILSNPAGNQILVAADMLLEGRHFERATATPEQIGRKALAVNLSDIAAMAGRPVAAFVTVAHHLGYGTNFAEQIHTGLAELADEYQVVVAGGDTNVWDGPVVIGVTLIGEVAPSRTVTRSGARPGDRVFVTGELGGSLPSNHHLTFLPRVAEALALHAAVELHAMIDISDGLVADLGHIAEESRVGIHIEADAVPLTLAAQQHCGDRTPLECALTDGEDFELAFCVSARDAERLRAAPPAGVTLFEIGEVIAGQNVTVFDANNRPLELSSSGWKHRW